MKFEDNSQDKPLFTVDDKPVIEVEDKADYTDSQPEGEIPVITIEQDDDTSSLPVNSTAEPSRKHHLWSGRHGVLFGVLTAIVVLFLVFAGRYAYVKYIYIGVPVSVSPKENIEKLSRPYDKKGRAEVVLTQDSILGVALDLYALHNLQAEVTTTEPDSTDESVALYTRCADHTSTKEYLGSMVMQGKDLQSDISRIGYCAMANGNIVIGVGKRENIKDYVVEQGGSFFRQFVLVSAGVLPTQFYLHGKVERAAIGRMPNDQLYFITTRHKETLWDFADALREYGFVDAIYITGGNCYSYYRTPDGQHHTIGNVDQHPHDEYRGHVPWMVYRARK